MKTEGFRKFLQEWGVSEDKIDPHISIAEKFEDFLIGLGVSESPTPDDVRAFSGFMIKEKLNSYDNFIGVALYGRFIGKMDIRNAVVELIDGAEALDNLYEKVGEELGEEKREEIFTGIELPPLGSPNAAKPKVTQAVMERLESTVGLEGTKQLLANCLRDLEDEWFLEDRKKYLDCKDFDEFLHRKGDDFITQLKDINKEDGLFFNQKITNDVIDYVDSHPEIRQGLREGNILYEAKIPYMTVEYLAETDEYMKRYYYCHCPWVRESLVMDDVEVPPSFCNCSAGFHKKYWEVVLDQPLKADVIETVLDGDMWCRFAIHLPEDLVAISR